MRRADVTRGTAGSSLCPVGRGRPAGNTVEDCPSGMKEQTVQHRVRSAGRSAVRGDYARVDTKLTSHTRLRACQEPGVPRALLSRKG